MTDPNPQLPPPLPGEEPPLAAYAPPAHLPPAYPPPAYPVTYQHQTFPAQRNRPGIITSIGVTSILVACLSTLATLAGGCHLYFATVFTKVSRLSNRPPTVYAAPAAPMATSTTQSADQYTVTIESSVSATPFPGSPASQPTVSTTALTPADVKKAVDHAQRSVGGKLNPAQIAALTTALSDPNQTLVTPETKWSPVRMGFANPDGNATIVFAGGMATMDPQGQLNNTSTAMPKITTSNTTFGYVGLEFLLSIGLAIFLFVAAIMTMCQAASSRKLHLIYALCKIPLAIGAAAAYWYLIGSLYRSQDAATGWAVGIGIAGLIYPLCLLVALNTRSVREYYRQATG
jgi:hypothetical protein